MKCGFKICRFRSEDDECQGAPVTPEECRLYEPVETQKAPVAKLPCSDGLVAMQAEAKKFIDANVWDGEDRSGATNDRATFNPDELQELIDDMLEHMSN